MEKVKKTLKTQLRASVCTLLIGMVARALHWPYAAGIIFSSFAAILILYAIRFSKKSEKKSLDIIKMTLVLFWTSNGLLRILDFQYTIIFQIGTALTFILWFAMEGTSYFMDSDLKTKNKTTDVIWNMVMVVGVLTIIVGGLMHLLSWDYATITLTTGLCIVTTYILKDIFSPSKNQNEDANNEELYS